MVSRQREWQKKQKALGNCVICGKPRDGKSVERCSTHLISQANKKRLLRGVKDD